MKVYTVTIWEKDERAPWTVSFDEREKAEFFKALAEKMISSSENDTLRVTMDSGDMNDTEYYLGCLRSELGVDIPMTDPDPGDRVKLYARYAISARYSAEIGIPRNQIPDKDAPTAEKENFIDVVSREADSVYSDANFGEAEDIDGKMIYVEDEQGDFIWEDGRLCKGFEQLKEKK